ncbi:MAG: class I SAM-dependent methyltransferase [Halothiobacillaceae bacterium]|nr:class I SAM-dependent methyltransferase [Halothiobacillaceae bacterium]
MPLFRIKKATPSETLRIEGFRRCDEDILAWYRSEPGRRVVEVLRPVVAEAIVEAFGYHALCLCPGAGMPDLLADARIAHRVHMSEFPPPVDVQGNRHELPFAGESLDLVVLFHTLDTAADPHAVLREVDRVLRPEGHLLLIGFQPLSLFSLAYLCRRSCTRGLRCGRHYTARRVRDWLSLLGYAVDDTVPLAHALPLCGAGALDRLEFVENLGRRLWPAFGGLYVLHGIRRVRPLLPRRPAWARPMVMPQGAPSPTTRSCLRDREPIR